MKRITVVTGDNTSLIEKSIKDKEFDIFKALLYPEVKKHPKEYCNNIRNHLNENKDKSHVIATFSDNIINLLGHMIYKKELSHADIEVIIVTEDNTYNANYDEEGFLENHPMGYFDYGVE